MSIQAHPTPFFASANHDAATHPPAPASHPAGLAFLCGVAMVATIVAALMNHTTTLAAIALFSIAIIYYSMKDMTTAIALFITYSALEGMFKYLNNWSMVIYAVKPILAVVMFVLWRLRTHQVTHQRSLRPPLTGLLVMLAIWGLIEIFNPLGLGLVENVLTLWMWYLGPIVFYFLAYDSVAKGGSPKQIGLRVDVLCYAIAVIGAVVAGFGLFQFTMGIDWTEAHLPGYAALHHPGWFVINARGATLESSFCPASTTDLGGSGGEWANLAGMLTLGLLFSPQVTLKSKVWLAVCYFLDIAGIWVSGVRLFVLLTVFQIPVFAVLSANSMRTLGRNAGLVLAVGVLIGGAVVIGQVVSKGIMLARYSSTLINPAGDLQRDRGGNLTYLPAELNTFPWGVGYHRGATDFAHREDNERFGDSDLGINRETQFNAIADDMGLPGTVILALFLAGALSLGYTIASQIRTAHERVMAACLFVLFSGYVVACALIGPNLQGREYVWVILALLFAMRPATNIPKYRRSPPDSPQGVSMNKAGDLLS